MLDEITVTAARPPPLARQPRTVVKINGISLPQCVIEWTVLNNSFLEADTFDLSLAANRLPTAMNATWFSSLAADTFVEIFGGTTTTPDNPDPSELTSFIYGRIDDIEYEPVMGIVHLKGRDLTGAFIDAKVSANYTNQTSSKIAALLVANHPGIAATITATSTVVGNNFSQDTLELTANRSEWDLLGYLARQEGFVVDVFGSPSNGGPFLYFGTDLTGSGTTLNVKYQPPSTYGGSPVANVETLRFSRIMTVAKGISVTVSSGPRWNLTSKGSYPAATRQITPGRATPFGAETAYSYNIPAGATPQQCVARARSIYNQIIQHAMKADFTLPADTTTDVTSSVIVTGTGTAFDQAYYPREITRTMKFEDGEDGGFSMTVACQNTDPNLTPAETPSGTPPADEGTAQDEDESQ